MHVEGSSQTMRHERACGCSHSAFTYRLLDAPRLLQCVHEAGDSAIQIFVVAAEFFDFVDGMKHRCVMFAAELAADLW